MKNEEDNIEANALQILSRMTRSSSGRLYEERYSPLVRAMPTKAAKCVPSV